jgi:hypothetical protein
MTELNVEVLFEGILGFPALGVVLAAGRDLQVEHCLAPSAGVRVPAVGHEEGDQSTLFAHVTLRVIAHIGTPG